MQKDIIINLNIIIRIQKIGFALKGNDTFHKFNNGNRNNVLPISNFGIN